MSSNVHFNDQPTSIGFLSGFIEGSIEMPSDGKNGDCIVHYKDEHSQYELMVKLVNGIREGDAMIINDGMPYLMVEYKNGKLTGVIMRRNEYLIVDLKGHLVNGIENGLFEEMDNKKKVVWRGYYRNGVRYSEVVESKQLSGYHDEKIVSSNTLLTIAQYDDSLHDKNGHCFEYVNGTLEKECIYENGVKKHTIREFVNGRMIVYDSTGKKAYEGKWLGDMKNGFLCHEPMEGMDGFFKEVDSNGQLIRVSQYDELNVYRNGKCFELENGKVKRVSFCENGEMKRVMMEFNGSTMKEYDESGKRVYEGEFTGDMKSGFVREGKGREYSNGGKTVVYAGDWKNGKREGLGTELKGFNPLYTGEWKYGKRNGEGEEMDERGKVVRNGWWVDGVFQEMKIIPSSLASNPQTIEELKIGNSAYKDSSVTEMKLCGLTQLKRIVIGDECFGSVRLFEMHVLPVLESIVIGPKCFTYAKTDSDTGNSKQTDGFYRIVNCPKLKSIQIGDYSFSDYHSFEWNSLPSLETITIGRYCFYWTPSFSLTDLPQLQSVTIGGFRAFYLSQSVVFENLPKLQSIQLGDESFRSGYRDNRKTTGNSPYNYKNTLTMRNLPSLTSIKGVDYHFNYIGSVTLENITKLTSSGIQLRSEGFAYTYSIQSSSTHSLVSLSFDAMTLESFIRNKSSYL